MPGPKQTMRVVGLHKLPFDAVLFEKDLVSSAGTDPEAMAEWRDQLRQNWENAWLVVVEFGGPADEIDFDEFGYPDRSMDAQVPWLEQVLDATEDKARAAFYLHGVDRSKPLWYGRQSLEFPAATPAPPGLLERVPYSSPD